jgi:hypothetical protein
MDHTPTHTERNGKGTDPCHDIPYHTGSEGRTWVGLCVCVDDVGEEAGVFGGEAGVPVDFFVVEFEDTPTLTHRDFEVWRTGQDLQWESTELGVDVACFVDDGFDAWVVFVEDYLCVCVCICVCLCGF